MKTLLVVDDNEQNRYLLHALFSGHGWAVRTAVDGAEALESAREQTPDVVITDILMPRMDGYTLCRHWKSDNRLKQIPLLFYTGTYTTPQDRQLALDMGADRFLLKPAEPEVLLATVGEVIGDHRVAREPSLHTPVLEETAYFKQYNEALIRKLEDKLLELENTKASLEQEVAERRRAEQLLSVRLKLIEFAVGHSLAEVLRAALDEIGELVQSPVGFYHFVESDGQTLLLQQWSTRTPEEFALAEGRGTHCPVEKAGVWADCVRRREPVIHNDCESTVNKNGMPEGHVQIARELVVPIMRGETLVAILGIGNKPVDYTQDDVRTVSFLADVTWTIVEQKRSAEALSATHERLRHFVEADVVGVIVTTEAGNVVQANDYYLNLVGFSQEDLVSGRVNWRALTPSEWFPADENALQQLHDHGKCTPYEKEYCRSDGTRVPVLLTAAALPGAGAEIAAFVVDLTDKKSLQRQLQQAQKMEAVGRLAGGVAHDFNNILQAIMGYGHMILDELPEGSKERECAEEIVSGTERAAGLTRQLLAFSRRQVLEMENLSLRDVVEGISKMINRVIGEDVELHIVCDAQLGTVRADIGQMEQVLLNLCINARDAMPEGGLLSIELHNVTLDEEYCAAHAWAAQGCYVLISVTDTGCGMEPQILDRIFEPFFTTKEVGKGTGLGLAMVYGIVTQHQGMVHVYSEVAKGTTFRIYLPIVAEEAVRTEVKRKIRPRGGLETILIAEDDDIVRALAARVLESAGYTVLKATNGREALEILRERGKDIDLVVSDVVMPELGGRGLYEQIQNERLRTRVLFSSGYSANAVHTGFVLDRGIELIQKPYAPATLLERVRESLDRPYTEEEAP